MVARRLLFGVLWPSQGGHTRSAIALAEVLRARGHSIEFVVDATAEPDTLIEAAGFAVHRGQSLYRSPLRPSFGAMLRGLVRQRQCDAIHWFEKGAGVRRAAAAARDTGCSFVWTVTSGGPPDQYYGLNRVVVYTDEVAHHAKRHSPDTAVHVLPARISLAGIDRALDAGSRAHIRARFDIPDTSLLIVRVARCAEVYVRSVDLGVMLAERMNRAGTPTVFLHAGFVNERGAAAEIRALVDAANHRAGRTIAYSETNPVAGATSLAAADICVASGRSAIEALAMGRPTIVAWGPQCLGLVDAGNIGEIAQTNFQGRQTTALPSQDETTERMERAVREHLADGESEHTRTLCAQFVTSRYSVENAADAYEALYDNRRVVLDSAVRYYRRPGNLMNELRCWLPSGVRRSQSLDRFRALRSSRT